MENDVGGEIDKLSNPDRRSRNCIKTESVAANIYIYILLWYSSDCSCVTLRMDHTTSHPYGSLSGTEGLPSKAGSPYSISTLSCRTTYIYIYIYIYIYMSWPPLWSSGQSYWLQIQRSRVRFPALPDFLSSSGSGTGSTQPREVNWGATWIKSSGSSPENRD